MAERRDYLQEINALRIEAAKTEELQAENKRLNAKLEEVRQEHRKRPDFDAHGAKSGAERSGATCEAGAKTGSLIVDIGEYNRVKEDLFKLERDYGKLVWARDHLETKVRVQKDSLKQWKEYRKSWILKHPNKRLSHLRPTSTSASPLLTAENFTSSSAPAPPVLPEGLTPSLSAFSKSPSPRHNATLDSKYIDYRHDQALEPVSGGLDYISNGTRISQTGHTIARASDSGGVTEASSESEGQARPLKIEPATGGSSPIMLFERSLKRRRSAKGTAQHIHVHEDDQRSPGAARRSLPPKDEQSSSSISPQNLDRLNEPHDSLDLDDVGGHLDTPRKRQRIAQERLKCSVAVPLATAQDEGGMLNDMTVAGPSQQFDDGHHAIECDRDKRISFARTVYRSPLEETAEALKNARRDERMVRQHAHNDRVHQRLEATERESPIIGPSPTTKDHAQRLLTPNDYRQNRQRKPQLANPVILQPRDVNVSVLPKTNDQFANRKRPCPPSRRDRGAAYVAVLAEDGEEHSSNGDANKAAKKSKDGQTSPHGPADKESRAPSTHHRLGALLNKHSPEKSLLTFEEPVDDVSSDQAWSKTPLPRSICHDRSKGPATPRSLPTKLSELRPGLGNKSSLVDVDPVNASIDRYRKSAQAVSKRTKHVPAFRKPLPITYPDTQPEHEPLRARPVHRLGLQDFKFNPAHGDYAYHESVRTHDEKKSLSGCTDRHCPRCKGLREYVTDSGYQTARKQGESQDEAEWRLMSDFLGDNHIQLTSMSTKERSDLLIEAKVKEFANRYGCHRQAFSRAREAPGVWQVDFPTTQEEAQNRAAADVMEREMVLERYWEATRSNGKWMFADE